MLFGHQINYVTEVLGAKRQPLDFGSPDGGTRATLAAEYSRVVMQVLVSVVILLASLYLLVQVEDQDTKKAATGFIGTVIGYWLR
jgi:hypothetical protein